MDIFAPFPILAAAAATMLLGAIWYHPRFFGAAWMRSVNISPELVERGKRRTHLYNLLALIASLLFASALYGIERAAEITDLAHAFRFGAVIGLGCILPALMGQLLWDQRPIKFFLMNAGFWIIAAEMAALIVSYR